MKCSERPADHSEHLEFWALGSEGELVRNLLPEFERRNPGIHVVVQQIPWTAAHEKLLTAFVGEATPDIAEMGNTWVPEFVAIRALDDLGPFAATSTVVKQNDYFPGIWATNVVGKTLYGIPWYVDTRVLFYRSDVLAAVGFPHGPHTWAEWREAMTRIRQQGRSKWAILLPTNEWEPITMLALSAHSTLLTSDGTRGAFSQPAFADAFGFYVDIFKQGWAPRVSNSQIANLYQQFAQGEFAMYITGPWNVGEFRRRLPPEMQDQWATAPLPAHDAGEATGISMAGGGSFVVFRASQHKAAARKLIEFLSEPAQQVRFYELTGDLPARRSAWLSPVLSKDSRFPAFRIQLEHVEPLPKVPEWEQIATAIFDRGEAAARGAVTPAVALAQLDTRADELLEKRRWMLSRSRGVAVIGSRGEDVNPGRRSDRIPTSHRQIGIANTALTSRAFSPAGFCGGEGADRRMRGRFTRTSVAYERDGDGRNACNLSRTSMGSLRIPRMRPPHPPLAPSPPAKTRGGRRTLDVRDWQEVQTDCEECGLRLGEVHHLATPPPRDRETAP